MANALGTACVIAGPPSFALAGAVLSGLANAWLWVSWGYVLTALDDDWREWAVMGSAAVQTIVTVVVMAVPPSVQRVLIVALGPLSAALWLASMGGIGEGAGHEDAAAPGGLAKRDRLSLMGVLALGLGVPMALTYYLFDNEALLAGSEANSSWVLVGASLLFSVLLWWFIHFVGALDVPSMGKTSASLLASVVVVLAFGVLPFLRNVLVLASTMFCQYFMLLYASRLVREGFGGVARTFGLVMLVGAVASALGSLAAALVQAGPWRELPQFSWAQALVLLAVFFVFVLAMWSVRSQSFAARSTVRDRAGREGSLRLLAERHHLSAREFEVLALLVDGRSAPYIRDELLISLSTANTHIRHIYAKFDVHGRQELLDKVHGLANIR